MSPKLRQAKIIDVVRQQGRTTVEELASVFSASRETIRRDLTALAETGKIQKIHGGAKLPQARGEGPFKQRMAENADAKRAIARKAANLVSPGDTIFIDTGSTTLTYADELADIDGLTVITNSSEIAKTVTAEKNDSRLILVGGVFDSDNQETCGPMAISQLGTFWANHAVITVGGIDAEAGVTDFNIDEAQVAQAMIAQSENLIVLADSSKFNRIGSFRVCTLDQIGYLVSDTLPDANLNSVLKEANVNVVC